MENEEFLKLINDFKVANNLSYIKIAKYLNISLSTLENWLYKNIMPKQITVWYVVQKFNEFNLISSRIEKR